MKLAGLVPTLRETSYPLRVANGKLMPEESRVTHEVVARLKIHNHHEEIRLDVFETATHDVILGLPWLRKHNPDIDWKNRKLSLRCDCGTTASKPTQRTLQLVDEKEINNISSHETRQDRAVDSTDADCPTGHQVRVKEDQSAPPDIPDEYKSYIELFRDDKTASALPKHKPWDHEIVLQEGKEPPFGPIYGMTEKELGVLREYLDENLEKGFIRQSTSPAGFPILFVPKKDGKLRPCIDYRELNAITVKNRYPLPNISELQDRLAGAKYFTALDLRGAYNLIRMKEGEEWKTAFKNTLWSLRVFGHAFWAHQCASYMSSVD